MQDRVLKPSYWRVTRSATYGFISALPLFLLYEVMIVSANRVSGTGVRVGADVWIRMFLGALGTYGAFAFGLVVCAVGFGVMLKERRNRLPLKISFFSRMVLESAVYAVLVGLLIATIVGKLMMLVPSINPQESISLFTQLALSVGAGLYEELVFRVILVGGLFWVLTLLPLPEKAAYIIAAVAGALFFSWVHYIGTFGDVFSFSSFAFRFLFGLALNVIFLIRGFGVAAWTHALYDVFVVTGLFRLL